MYALTKDSIIRDFLCEKEYILICKRISFKNWDDIYQELCICLCQMDEAKIKRAYENKYFKFLVIRIIKNIHYNRRRPQSPLFTCADLSIDNSVFVDSIDCNIDELEESLNKQLCIDEKKMFFESKLMKAYIKYGSYRKLAKETNVPYNTIQNTLKPYIKDLKKRLTNG